MELEVSPALRSSSTIGEVADPADTPLIDLTRHLYTYHDWGQLLFLLATVKW